MAIFLSKRNRSEKRRGAAAVELSICLPLFVLVIAGSMETCNLIYLRESMCVASYEAARMAVKEGADSQEAIDRSLQILEDRGFEDMEVVIEPADLADLEAGALVTVEITTPTHTQTMLPQSLEGEHEIGTKTVLAKE